MHGRRAVCSFFALLGEFAVPDDEVPRLLLEQALVLRLEPGTGGGTELPCGTRVDVIPDLDGPLTVWVESLDADPRVRHLDADGTVLAEDDDGAGVGWNSQLRLHGVAGEPLALLVGFATPEGGTMTLRAKIGAAPVLQGEELAEAWVAFWTERGRLRRERGRKLEAAVDLHEGGQLEFRRQHFANGRVLYREVLALAEELDHPLLATTARARVGAVCREFQELTEAQPLLEAAVEGAVALQHAPLEMLARSELGQMSQALGRHTDALASFQRCLEIARALDDVPNEVVLCSQMGKLCLDAGQGAQAEAWHAQAVARARELGNAATLADALLDAGRFSELRGEYRFARERLEEALALATLPRQRATILGRLGNVAMRTGNDLDALDLYERVLADARQLGDKGVEIAALGSLGQIHGFLGDAAKARRHLDAALDRLGRDGDPRERAALLQMWANASIAAGDLFAARAPLDEALHLARESADRSLEGRVLASLVAWHDWREEYAEALEPARRHLDLSRELGLEDHEAMALASLGELHLRLGDAATGRERSEQAVERLRRLGDDRMLQTALLTLVEIEAKDGNVAAVERVVREAEACFERIALERLDPDRLSLLRAQDSFARWGEYGQDLLALSLRDESLDAAEAQRLIEEGFRRAGVWKGRALLQGIAEHRRGARSPRVLDLRRERRDLLSEREELLAGLSEAIRAAAAASEIEDLRQRVLGLGRRADQLLAELQESAPAEAALDEPSGIDTQRLSAVLGDDDVLVEYVDGRRRLYAYVLHRGTLRFHDLGERREIEEQVSVFLAGMERPDRLASPGQVAQRGSRLHAALLRNVLPADVSADARLVVVPTAALAALPFETLVAAAPGRPSGFDDLTFVLDRFEVVYAPSAPVLALLSEIGPRTASGAALILADPVYPSEDPSRAIVVSARAAFQPEGGDPDTTRAAWVRLPGTRREALAIADVLQSLREEHEFDSAGLAAAESERSFSWEDEVVSLHLGVRATPELLRGDLRPFALIHCASHGWFDGQDPRRSGLVLTPGADGDGFLSVADILELDLDADLSVLSACETGRGEIRRGEGVLSLARAFLYAGSRSVICSLWPVDDYETEQVMRHFYADFAGQGLSPAAALRRARLAVRNAPETPQSFRGTGRGLRIGSSASAAVRVGHPYFWAAFVYVGLPGAPSRAGH